MWKKFFPAFRYFFKYAKAGMKGLCSNCTFVFLIFNTD